MSEKKLEYKEWITGIFDRAAPTYDHVGPRFWSYFGKRLVELAGLHSGASVLDVGCGRGAILFPAARQVGPSGYVVGVDISETMVAETTAEIKDLGLSNAEARLMDVEEGLAFPDGHFDFVFCGFVLGFFDHLDRALCECVRVLKPNGTFLASTFGSERDERWKEFGRTLRPYWGRLRPEPDNSTRGLKDPAEIEDVLSTAGLVSVEVMPENKEFYLRDENEWWAFEWSHGNRSIWERMGPSDLEQFKQEAFDVVRRLKGDRGIPRPMPMLLTRATKP